MRWSLKSLVGFTLSPLSPLEYKIKKIPNAQKNNDQYYHVIGTSIGGKTAVKGNVFSLGARVIVINLTNDMGRV